MHDINFGVMTYQKTLTLNRQIFDMNNSIFWKAVSRMDFMPQAIIHTWGATPHVAASIESSHRKLSPVTFIYTTSPVTFGINLIYR